MRKIIYAVIILAAALATPALFKYAAAHRTFSGVGGEALLIPLAVAACGLIEQSKELLMKMWKEGEEE